MPDLALADVVAAWNTADPAAIHPTRARVGEAAYWRSGEIQAVMLADVLKPASRVVDFGCGDGRVTIPLAAAGHHVTGADASAAMLARLTERAPDIPTIQSTGPDLAQALGRKTDAVVALAVLIHHGYDDGAAIVRGLAQAVKKGGLLVLDWPTSARPHERAAWIDVTTWSVDQQQAVAAEVGLAPVETDLPWSVWRR